ncbi:hypothetical protein RHAL1_00266 [Beijerinckiaceae bacterium RH AL1]|nr:hypothetical protein RHAL8_00256 [Beijerinckiaceae bacterium RH AL8]VVB42578.1 hypothetical protein RHCH11_RHCH11_00257 [Beijerinckiaceae bacterium RH CH11]VVC53385.1 hypothetical protein RHAL1_00266 [Beijerinckiaceae bacterium RH AL1]
MPGHDVTVPVDATVSGGARGCLPRSKVSMIVIRPPQQGQHWPRIGLLDRLGTLCERWRREQLSGAREIGLAAGACEQAVVADAMEALGQEQEEAADELVDPKRHGAVAIGAVATVVFEAEGDAGVVDAISRRFAMATRCV